MLGFAASPRSCSVSGIHLLDVSLDEIAHNPDDAARKHFIQRLDERIHMLAFADQFEFRMARVSEVIRPLPVERPGERQRLDRALAEAGRRADAVSRAQIEAFEAALRIRRRGSSAQGASLRREIDELTMPEISDPGIFNAPRTMALLDHVIDAILPSLDTSEDVASIAKAMLKEEIDRRRDLEERLMAEGDPA